MMGGISKLRADLDKIIQLWANYWPVLLYIEVAGLYRAFVPNKSNNATRKIISIVFVGSWALVFVLDSMGYASPPANLWVGYTAIVFMILGRIWQLEIEQFPVDITFEGGDNKNK